jgi:hypothetical protein
MSEARNPTPPSEDEGLAFELIAGRFVSGPDGVISHEYLKPGSDREREARAAMVRLLCNTERELSFALRTRLAALFDADHPNEAREAIMAFRLCRARVY